MEETVSAVNNVVAIIHRDSKNSKPNCPSHISNTRQHIMLKCSKHLENWTKNMIPKFHETKLNG
jgi:hypothetical protein